MKKWAKIGSLGAIVCLGMLAAYGSTAKARIVETARVNVGDIVDLVKATGRVESVEEFIVRAKAPGKIEKVLKEEGERVSLGENLILFDLAESEDVVRKARLKLEQAEIDLLETSIKMQASDSAHADPSEMELNLKTKERQLNQNKINKESAERELSVAMELYKIQAESLSNLKSKRERFEKSEMDVAQSQGELEEAWALFSKKEKTHIKLATLKNEFEKAKRQKALAQEELSMATLQNKRLRLVSTMNGTVVSKDIKVGMTVPVGEPLMTVADLDRLRVRVEVDEVDAWRIRKGQVTLVSFESYADRKFRGHVDRVAPKAAIKGERTVVEVIINIDEKTDLLRISNQVDVRIVISKKSDILKLPLSTVHRGDTSFVWALHEGKVRKSRIKTGLSDLDSIEIVKGLKAGDLVIAGNVELKDGEQVDIR